jgi:hypothetical protein
VGIYSREDFHQSGFSRAVLTAQAMNFPAPDLETDVIQRYNAGELFGYILEI